MTLGINSAYEPGINTKGRYQDYAKIRGRQGRMIFKKVDEGTYEYFYPAMPSAI
jgi:hypothetical protein